MGGQSYKCPECGKWFLVKGALRDHAKQVHGKTNFEIVGVGSLTRIEDKKSSELKRSTG